MPLLRSRGFDLNWQADIPLTQFDIVAKPIGDPDILVECIDNLPDRIGAKPINRGMVYPDGFRFAWNDEAVFDMFDGNRIAYVPGPDWRGELPASFYSTVVGLTLAWRGLMPMHATAIEIDGKAILLAGKAGAGKSTLAAELIIAGAHLISDDLTVLDQHATYAVPVALRGRQAMRLHPATAASMDTLRIEPVPEDSRGKVLAWPKMRSGRNAVEVSGLILLGSEQGKISPFELAPMLPRLLFRPSWTKALPGLAAKKLNLLALATQIPAFALPGIGGFTADDRSRRVANAQQAIRQFAN